MKEMKPMAPMKPMESMKPMQPMEPTAAWWPADLGSPASNGSSNDLRYAYFPERRRVVVDRGNGMEIYDSGDFEIQGARHASDAADGPVFSTSRGDITLADMRKVQQ